MYFSSAQGGLALDNGATIDAGLQGGNRLAHGFFVVDLKLDCSSGIWNNFVRGANFDQPRAQARSDFEVGADLDQDMVHLEPSWT